MTIRRQLFNFGGKSTDYRAGTGVLDDLPRMCARLVAKPRLAVLAAQRDAHARCGETVRRALVDSGFEVVEVTWSEDDDLASFASVGRLLDRLGLAGITGEDVVVGLGDARACSLAAFCAHIWCGGVSCLLVPTTLDGMATLVTEMRALDVPAAPGAVSTLPRATLVACDLDLVAGAPMEERGLGLVRILATYLCDSKRTWAKIDDLLAGLAAGEADTYMTALFDAQTSRVNTLKASSPSSRQALLFGETTAAALAACLDEPHPEYLLLAEGMRFEARLAVDAAEFKVDDVFKLDDCLDELGIEELGFTLEADRFIDAIKVERFRRVNRFMLPLPKRPGYIRLCTVDDEVLRRHADAYLGSRAELLEDGYDEE